VEKMRDTVRNVDDAGEAPTTGLGTEISSLFSKVGLDSEIPELRGGSAGFSKSESQLRRVGKSGIKGSARSPKGGI
jgi:hypothetical protein